MPFILVMLHFQVVHFIRHAQGFHNVAGELDHANYASEKYFDAHLTEKGWRQVQKQGTTPEMELFTLVSYWCNSSIL